MIKWIAFDLDNTLYSESQYVEGCYQNIVKNEFNGNISVFNRMREIRSLNGDSEVFQLIRDEFGKDSHFVERCLKYYHEATMDLSLYDGVIETLKKLSRSYKLAVLTNGGQATQENKIRNLGIGHLFDKIIITGACLTRDEWKPNPKAFEYMLHRLGCTSDEIVFVGDSVEKDIKGASSVGIQSILVDRKENAHPNKSSYWTITKFEDIISILGDEENVC